MSARIVRLIVGMLPLAGALALLRLMPVAAQAPLAGALWRIEPLALVGSVLLALLAATPQPSLGRALRLTVGAAGTLAALLAATPELHLLLLVGVSVVLLGGLGPRWYLALGLEAVATILPDIQGLPPLLATHPHAVMVAALLLAAWIGMGGLPWRWSGGTLEWEIILRPVWLFPLLRTLTGGPWPGATAVIIPLAAAVAAAVAALGGLREANSERVLAAVLLLALVSAGLTSTFGIVAALWIVLLYGCLMIWMRGGRRVVQGITVLVLIVLATWWAAGAAAAGGAFLLAGGIWLIGSVTFIATVLPDATRPKALASRGSTTAGMLLLAAIALFTPVITRFAALPVADQLDPGLSSFGLVDLWPWIGVGALDAAHRRVALQPGIVLTALFLTVMAALWLILRVVTIRVRHPTPEIPPVTSTVDKYRTAVRHRVWWLRGGE